MGNILQLSSAHSGLVGVGLSQENNAYKTHFMCPWLMLVLNLEIVDHNVKRLLYLVLNLQNSDYMQPFLNNSQIATFILGQDARY